MSAESDLLRVVLALQMGFVTKEQVVECGALWAEDRRKPLTEILAEKGFLKPGAKTALEGMVQAKIEWPEQKRRICSISASVKNYIFHNKEIRTVIVVADANG